MGAIVLFSLLVIFVLVALNEHNPKPVESDYVEMEEDYLYQCKCFGIDIDVENKILTVKGRDQQDLSVYRDIQILMDSYYGIMHLEENPLFVIDGRVIREYGWKYVKT